MIRIALVLAVCALSCAAARAQAPAPTEQSDIRFSFNRVQDGYLRLDSRTGQVSLCSRRAAGWACEPVPEKRPALEAEAAELRADNEALKRALEAHGLPLPNSLRTERVPPRAPDIEIRLPNNKDVERAVEYLGQIWRRLVETFSSTQKDAFKI
jgi:hypothetical protein